MLAYRSSLETCRGRVYCSDVLEYSSTASSAFFHLQAAAALLSPMAVFLVSSDPISDYSPSSVTLVELHLALAASLVQAFVSVAP